MAEQDPRDIARLTISLGRGDSPDRYCTEYADFVFDYFMTPVSRRVGWGRYQHDCSIIVLTDTPDAYLAASAGSYARRKLRRAERDGYTFASIERDDYLDDIFAINTSMQARQGRPMDEHYRKRPEPYGPLPEYTCPRHRMGTYGVLKDGHLVAYTWVYMSGEMCMFNTILGHGDHMEAGVMYLLVAGVIRELMTSAGLRYAMYERHTSGTEGLRFFKERMGFGPHWVDWQRADEPVTSKLPLFLEQRASRWHALSRLRRVAGAAKRRLARLLP